MKCEDDGESNSYLHQAFHAGCKQFYWVKISPLTNDLVIKTPCSKLETNTVLHPPPHPPWLFCTNLQRHIHIVEITCSCEYTVVLFFGFTRKFLVFQDTLPVLELFALSKAIFSFLPPPPSNYAVLVVKIRMTPFGILHNMLQSV